MIVFRHQKNYIDLHLLFFMENEELIISRLDALKADIDSLKEHILDVTLTSDDLSSLKEADKDFVEGKTKRL